MRALSFVLFVVACGAARAVSLSVQEEINITRGEFVLAANGTIVAYRSFPREFLGDGDEAAFYEQPQIAVRNLASGKTVVASRYASHPIGDATFEDPAISPDGRYVAFRSFTGDVFWVDMEDPEQSTQLISTSNQFGPGPLISADGSEVAFVKINTRELEIVSSLDGSSEAIGFPELPEDSSISLQLEQFVASDDLSRFVAVFGGTVIQSPPLPPELRAAFVYTRQTGAMETIVADGTHGVLGDRSFAISGDGNVVAYAIRDGSSSNWALHRRDLRDGKQSVLHRTSFIADLDLSHDGKRLAFVEGDGFRVVRQVFIWNAPGNRVRLVSGMSPGKPGNGDSIAARISDDGEKVFFNSEASNFSVYSQERLYLAEDLDQVRLDGGSSGWWYNADQSGHGFSILVLPGDRIVLLWFAYSDQGVPLWIYAEGTFDAAVAELDAFVSPLGAPPPAFNAGDIILDPVGTIGFEIEDCANGRVSWDLSLPGFGQGELPVSRLAQAETLTCL